MDMSFYGGKQGKSFRIAKIFENKAEMLQDLQARWNSSIGINELVFINYGNPADKTIYKKKGESSTFFDQTFIADKDMTRWEFNRYVDINVKVPTKVEKEDIITYELIVDGKLFNTTIWEKCYTSDDELIAKDERIDPVNGMDKYVISDDFGIGYHLIASLTGNVPMVTANSEWIFTDQEPKASIDNSDVERPNIHFKLPKGLSYLYGTKLVTRSDTTATITENELNGIKFGTGDYYINSNNGNTYICTAVEGATYTFEYRATLARRLDGVDTTVLSPFTNLNGVWSASLPTAASNMTDEHWRLNFSLPKASLFTTTFTTLEPAQRQEIAVTGAVKDVDTYNFNFAIAKPSIWLNGTGAPNNEAVGENGDYYLDNEGWGVYFKEGNAWNLTTNIKGAKGDKGEKGDQGIQGEQGIQGIQGEKGNTGEKGDKGDTGAPITVADYYDFTYDATVTGYTKVDTRKYKGNLNPRKAVDIPQFGAIAEEVYGHTATAANLFSVDYTDSEGETNGYWIFKTDAGAWDSIKVTGSAGSLAMLLQNTYDDTNSTDKTYTVNYTNTLISEFRNNFTSINNDLNQVVKVSSEQWKKGGILTLERNLLQKIKDTSAQIDNLALEISEDSDTMFDSIFSNIQNQINAAEASAEQATSVTLSFTIPLKSSGTGAWSTTSDSKTQVVLSIANKFTSDKQPMITCKDINNDDYGNIESISFDTNSITIVMSKENSKEINLFAFYPQ